MTIEIPEYPTNPDTPGANNLVLFARDKKAWQLDDSGQASRIGIKSGLSNYFLNSQYLISQDAVLSTNTNGGYPVDGWRLETTLPSPSSTLQVSTVHPIGPYGGKNSLQISNNAAIGNADVVNAIYPLEGYFIMDFEDKGFWVSFWAGADATGTYALNIRTGAFDATYTTLFNCVSGGWVLIEKFIPWPTIGTVSLINTVGLYFGFMLIGASASYNPSVDTWNAGNFQGATGMTNPSTGTLYIYHPMLSQTEFEYYPNLFELDQLWAKRYYERFNGGYSAIGVGSMASANLIVNIPYKEKRASPTLNHSALAAYAPIDKNTTGVLPAPSGVTYNNVNVFSADARLTGYGANFNNGESGFVFIAPSQWVDVNARM